MKSTGMFYRSAIFAFVALAATKTAAAVCYVDGAATGVNDGSSWNNAYTNPQFALLNSSCAEIWVAKGVYKPTLGADPSISFVVPPAVTMYGGFVGNETTRDARVPAVNVTVLSGDVDNNDANVSGSQVDVTPSDIHGTNSNHVVYMDGVSGTPITGSTVLDGFTVTGGNAIAGMNSGGGLFCNGAGNDDASAGRECSPTLRNLIFSGNFASQNGGGVFNDAEGRGKSSPTLIDVTFTGDVAGNAGGGMANFAEGRGLASPHLNNVMFIQNVARLGGGMSSRASVGADAQSPLGGVSSPILTSVVFVGNSADTAGGAMYNEAAFGGTVSPVAQIVTFSENSTTGTVSTGGAVFNTCQGDGAGSGICAPSFVNVTFSGNLATQFGGALYSESKQGASAQISLTNVTISENRAATGGGIYTVQEDGAASLTATNLILWNDVAATVGGEPELVSVRAQTGIAVSVVEGGCPIATTISCTTVSSSDPRLGPLAENGGYTRTRLPGFGSSAIDTGLDAACPNVDQRGVSRPQGPHCEIGAVEVIPTPPPNALPQAVTTPRDTAIAITLTATDTNPGGPFTFAIVDKSGPSHGSLTLNASVATYTPDAKYTGLDGFNFTATDRNGTSTPATVTIHVLPKPPVAQPRSLFVPHNTAGNVQLIATDDNVGSGPIAYTFNTVTVTSHGTISLSGDIASYTPTMNYTGPDSFTYTATDVNGISEPALVTIQVGPAPPVAMPRTIVVPHNTSKQIVFGASDDGLNCPCTYTFATASSPLHGTLGAVAGQLVTYTPTHDYSGPDSFTYTATDVNGTSVPATVTITVLPVSGGTVPGNASPVSTLSFLNLLGLSGLFGVLALRKIASTRRYES